MAEITLQLSDMEMEGATAEELVEHYLEQAQLLLRQKIRELVEHQLEILAIKDPFKVSFAEFERMSEEEQAQLRCVALRRYGQWVDAELARRKAAWILVVGGEVISYETCLDSLPTRSYAYTIAQQKKLAPFLFTKEPLIEEVALPSHISIWSSLAPDDAYPTIPVLIAHSELPDDALVLKGLSLIADFDTGSPAIFLNQDNVRGCGVDLEDLMPLTRFHLGRPYHYVVPTMKVAIPTRADTIRSGVFQVYAVRDWSNSPLTLVNLSRQGLVGRNVLLQFGMEINLNGQSQSTTVLR
jgi:hypothetical protein